jgi:CYTH domain-containing protein
MGLEKERKFILNDQEGMVYAPAFVIQQGYLFLDNQKEVRIRLYNGFEFKKAELCIKTYITNSSRKEFEYEIPFQDAVELYSKCEFKLEKSRQSFEYHDIHVDIDYYPSGLKIVELEFSDEILKLPSFCGEEVTGKYEYTNIYLAKTNKEFYI